MAKTYTVSPCPCGHPVCKHWHVNGVAARQGVSFTEVQARAVADLLTIMDISTDHARWVRELLSEKVRG